MSSCVMFYHVMLRVMNAAMVIVDWRQNHIVRKCYSRNRIQSSSRPSAEKMLDQGIHVTTMCIAARSLQDSLTYTAVIIQAPVTVVSVMISGVEFNYRELLRHTHTHRHFLMFIFNTCICCKIRAILLYWSLL